MSDIQKTLELEGMLLRAAEEKLLALEAENAALREEIQVLRFYGNKDCTSQADAVLEEKRKE